MQDVLHGSLDTIKNPANPGAALEQGIALTLGKSGYGHGDCILSGGRGTLT